MDTSTAKNTLQEMREDMVRSRYVADGVARAIDDLVEKNKTLEKLADTWQTECDRVKLENENLRSQLQRSGRSLTAAS